MKKVLNSNQAAFLRYLLMALGGVLINLIVAEILQDSVGLGFTTSLAIGYLAGLIYGFFATRLFAFTNRAPYSIKREAVKYLAVSITAWVVTTIMGTVSLYLVTIWIQENHSINVQLINLQESYHLGNLDRNTFSRLAGIGFGFFVNYFGHKNLTFRDTGTINFIRKKQAEFASRKKS